jgi:Relaxase/Mobilisation nuclease domain
LGGGKGALKPISFGSRLGVEKTGSSSRTMAQRYVGMAKGSQSAVVKLTSYGGSARLGSMVNYISREGKLTVENEWGETLRGSADLSAVRGDWDHLMSERADSRDIGVIKAEINFAGKVPSPDDLHDDVCRVLSAAYGGRKFAYGLSEGEGGRVHVDGIVMLRDADGNRLTGDAKANEFVVEAFAKSEVSSEISASFRFGGHGNGVEYASSRLRGLVEKFDDDVRDQSGSVIATEGAASALMQRGWREEMHSRKARDVMHVMVSARAGTDADQFREATREFLSKQFGGHRYVWAVHDPADDPKDAVNGGKRPHVHAHAVITMRSDYGDRVCPTIATFRDWRLNMSEAARNHGIAMEMTDRRDVAAAAAYTKGQVRPIYDSGRTRHAGTSEAAQARYERKRAETPSYASTDHSRAYARAARQQWQVMAMAANDRNIVAFAERVESRIVEAQEPDATPKVAGVPERDTIKDMKGSPMREMTRDDLNAYESRVGAELSRAAARIGPEDKVDFDRTVKAV